jgi:hypothetical protein
MRALGPLVAVLVVLAGCSGFVPADELSSDASATASSSADAGTNPWASDPVVVSIRAPADQRARYRNLTRRALDYWETNSAEYVGYPVEFRLTDDAMRPDVRITFVEYVRSCGREDHAAGCAPRIENPRHASLPADVEVKTGFDDASTVRVIEHELGHVLGLGHDDAPRDVMAGVSQLTTLPRPNASEQSLPWNDDEFAVYVDRSEVDDRNWTAVDRQLSAALGYYEHGANETAPDGVRFRRTENESAADVVVRFGPGGDCTEGGSCGRVRGVDPDGDGAFERYTRQEITLVGTDTDAVAWHVAYWLAVAFGMDHSDERPPPLRPDATYAERRSTWWE